MADVDNKAMERLTRHAQHFPVKNVQFRRVTVPEGELYAAYGLGDQWYGLWAVDYMGGFGQDIQGHKSLNSVQFRDALFSEARKALIICKQ